MPFSLIVGLAVLSVQQRDACAVAPTYDRQPKSLNLTACRYDGQSFEPVRGLPSATSQA